jgi:D-alanine transaminase
MSRVAFVNGSYIEMGVAHISIEDRAVQFGDSIYEVIHFIEDFYVDAEGHLNRLERSLSELKISMPLPRTTLMMHVRHLRKKNRVQEGFVYIQVSRGQAPRNHLFPLSVEPTLIMTIKRQPFLTFEPKKIITLPDLRWGRCDIKTTNLLPNILAKQQAFEEDAFECWMIGNNGFISEGSLSNAWMIRDECIYTAPTTSNILEGVTRRRLIELARKEKIGVVEKAFTLKEVYQADEAFNSSSNAPLTPVVQINDQKIGKGIPGPVSQRLYQAYMRFIEQEIHQHG